jgi:hypothetical protein
MGFGSRATNHSERAWDLGAGRQATVKEHGMWEQDDKPQREGVDWAAKGQATVGGHRTVEQGEKNFCVMIIGLMCVCVCVCVCDKHIKINWVKTKIMLVVTFR